MRITKAFITLIVFCAAAATLQAEKLKIGTVDISKVYNKYYKTEEAQEKFEISVKNAQEQIDKMRKDGKVLIDDLKRLNEERQNTALSTSRRNEINSRIQRRQTEIQKKDQDLQEFVRDSQQAINESRNSYNSLLLDEIKAVVKKVTKKKDLDIVFDISGRNSNSVPSVYYTDKSWEITNEVLKTLNKR